MSWSLGRSLAYRLDVDHPPGAQPVGRLARRIELGADPSQQHALGVFAEARWPWQ